MPTDSRNIVKHFEGKHVVIVHGYTASPSANWFPWLSTVLRNNGARVDVPALPTPQAPEPLGWATALKEVLPHADINTFLVGHSLGCVAMLRHVLTLPMETRLGGLLLVSGFDRTLSTLPELSAFTATQLPHAEIRKRILQRTSIFSDNDAIVDPAASQRLAAALDTDVKAVAGGGHFLDREGFTQFHEVYEALMDFVSIEASKLPITR